ncbi:endonuclease domain-containing protein [Rubrivirga sp.]|uniref:endonuclease domain-containing protein n=1 Tax=Rubrivirga sp. TaxID=1885344 RepID=UPI003C778E1A
MSRGFQPYERRLVPLARGLRRRMTIPERRLWARLRRRALGIRFLRQRPVGSYIVDFLAPDARLVLEVDGRSHDGRGLEDETRQSTLEALGLTVLRVTNDDVLQNLESVVDQIRLVLEDLADDEPQPDSPP